jgi:hypothetical protein
VPRTPSRTTSSNNVVDKKLIGHQFLGNFGSLLGFSNVTTLLPSKALENGTAEGND